MTPAANQERIDPWRILLVEDNPDDAELVGIELAHAGIDAQLRRVDNEAHLLEALRAFTPQLVLSDINLPGFSGLRAIELVREHAPDAWFVFLSGQAPRDPHAGPASPMPDAHLSKDHLNRLPALVRGLLGG